MSATTEAAPVLPEAIVEGKTLPKGDAGPPAALRHRVPRDRPPRQRVSEPMKYWGSIAASLAIGMGLTLVAAWAADGFTRRSDAAKLERELTIALFTEHVAAAQAFGNHFHKSLNLAYRMQRDNRWLTDNPPDSLPPEQQESRLKRRGDWDGLRDKYLDQANVVALCANLEAMSSDPETRARLGELREICTVMLDGCCVECVEHFHDEANRLFPEVIVAVGRELREERDRARAGARSDP